MFHTLWRRFQDQDLHLPGYITHEANCVYTRRDENFALIIARSRPISSQQIVNHYQLHAAAAIGIGAYLRSEQLNIWPVVSRLEEDLMFTFSESTTFEIANGNYRRLLEPIASKLEKTREQINVCYGKISSDFNTLIRLFNTKDKTILECYHDELKEYWSIGLPITDERPAKLKEIISELSSNYLSREIISIEKKNLQDFEQRYVSTKRIKTVITELYRGGLYWRSQKIPDRTDLALEAAANELHLGLQLLMPEGNRRPFWCSSRDRALDLAINSKSN